jgi:hypothetical protein
MIPRQTLTILFVLVTFATSLRAGDECSVIIDRAIKSHGGNEALTKARELHVVGKGTEHRADRQIDFKFEAWLQPEQNTRIFTVLLPNDVTVTEVQVMYKGRAWFNSEGRMIPLKEEVLAGKRIEEYAREVRSLVTLRDGGYSFEQIPSAKVEGKEALGVRVRRQGRPDIDLFFDKESGLLRKTAFKKADVAIEQLHSDYKEVGGAKVPHSMKIFAGGRLHIEEVWSEAEIVAPADKRK